MEDKDQTPPVQVPSEANDFKHIDTPETIDDKVDSQDKRPADNPLKNKAGSDFSSDIMQTEYDIDPGNEHHHQVEDEAKNNDKSSDKNPVHATDDDDDGLGTAGS